MSSERCHDCHGNTMIEDTLCTTCDGTGIVRWGEKDQDGFTPEQYEAGRMAKLEAMRIAEEMKPTGRSPKSLGFALLSPDERRALAKRASAASRGKRHTFTPEERSRGSRIAARGLTSRANGR